MNLSKKKDITFDVFYNYVWRLGELSICSSVNRRQLRAKEKAKYVFDQLDTDSNGYINGFELEKLLIQWSLPKSEVDSYLANDDDKLISIEEFHEKFKPV